MTPLLAAVLLTAFGASAAPAPQNVVGAAFEVQAPRGWGVERKPDGAVLTGPSASGLPTRVIVRWIGPDHAYHTTAEAYMAQLTRPATVPMKGWKDGAVETVAVSGRKALRLQRDTTEFVPPHSMSPEEVPMREEHLAVPASKGFYLLIYTAPRSLDTAQRKVFRRLVEKSFKPKL